MKMSLELIWRILKMSNKNEMYGDPCWEQEMTHEQAKLEYYLSVLEEEERPYQMDNDEYQASLQHIKGELCGQLENDVHIKRSMNLLVGHAIDGLKLRKRSSTK